MKLLMSILKEHKLKVTPQRLTMMKIIREKGHIDIDQLYVNLKNEFPAISLSTLYKNVGQFLDNEIIREIAIPNHKNKYEISFDEHPHFICSECGNVRDLKFGDEVSVKIQNLTGEIKNISLNIYGNCC